MKYKFTLNSDSQLYAHAFGGIWTKKKLIILQDYLSAYTKALKNQPFIKIYIDAFAGTGSIHRKASRQKGLFLESESGCFDGSVKIALKTVPAFDKFIFIEKNRIRYRELQKLKLEYPEIDIRKGNANE